ncbi:MAG: hypothetical protein JXR37_21855 [Kiritimatiellae bacterium]|nr:hypothetical protein [Kiritimatiellia bacterium]
MGEDLTIAEVDARMSRDGFPEMAVLWARFKRLGVELASIDEERLAVARRAHTGGLISHPLAMVWVTAFVVAGVLFYFRKIVLTAFPPGGTWIQGLMGAAAALNLVFVFWQAVVLVQRYGLHPMNRLMALDLAGMLRKRDYRRWFEGTAESKAVMSELAVLGINANWDNPDYRVVYGPACAVRPREDCRALIHRVLAEFLGHKDAERRKWQPGRHTPHLLRQKATVTEFVNAHAAQLARSRQGDLPLEEGLLLLRELRDRYVTPHSAGAERLGDCIEAVERGDGLTTGLTEARVWRRDPWVDLTHQDEFYSSASLRGVKLIGRGTKGRLGTFGYLRNRSISALDFRTRRGRLVRARIAAARAARADGRAAAVLFVDGVEGSAAVSPETIRRAIEDYARACGFGLVFYNGFVLNSVPQRFVRHVRRAGATPAAVRLRYLDAARREYLDAFGLPLEPFEYAYPRGWVAGYAAVLDAGKAAAFVPPGRLMLLAKHLKANALWFLVASALGYGLWSMWNMGPGAVLGFAVLITAGVAMHLAYQRRSLLGVRDAKHDKSI